MQARSQGPQLDWLELVLAYACNCRCAVCPSWRAGSRQMTSAEVASALSDARQRGARRLWLGGGEPTLVPGLPRVISSARGLGYERVRLQTNALRLSYPAYTSELVRAGLTEVGALVVGPNPALHDAFVGVPGAFEHLERALLELSRAGVSIEIDVLLTRHNLHAASEIVAAFAARGAARFWFWLVSLYGIAREYAPELPRLAEVSLALHAAFAKADELGVEAFTLHTPPCVLVPADRERYRPASRFRLLVVTPGGAPFMAESSPMEGGFYPPPCAGCSLRADCLGARADYVAVHGVDELVPLPSVARETGTNSAPPK